MTSRILKPKAMLAVLASFVFAYAIIALVAVAANANTGPQQTRDDDSAQVQYSRGFPTFNMSSHTIKLINITGDGNFEGRPADGTLVPPNDYSDIEVQWKFLSTQNDTAHYAILGQDGQPVGTFDVMMKVWGIDGSHNATCTTSIGRCTVGHDAWMNSTQINLLDAAAVS